MLLFLKKTLKVVGLKRTVQGSFKKNIFNGAKENRNLRALLLVLDYISGKSRSLIPDG